MRIKVTKRLAKFLQDNIKEYTITFEKFTQQQYHLYVDMEEYNHENDYDIKTHKFNVIQITYPHHYYAMANYLTTNTLTKIFNNCYKTVEDFIEKVKEEIEI